MAYENTRYSHGANSGFIRTGENSIDLPSLPPARVVIAPHSCTAYFRHLTQFPLLPAHASIGLAIDTLNTVFMKDATGSHLSQTTYGPIVLTTPVRPADTLTIYLKPHLTQAEGLCANVSVMNQYGQPVLTVDDTQVPQPKINFPPHSLQRYLGSYDIDTLNARGPLSEMYTPRGIFLDTVQLVARPDLTAISHRGIGVLYGKSEDTTQEWHTLIEAAFQTVGLVAMSTIVKVKRDTVPISVGIDGEMIVNGIVPPGKTLYVYAEVDGLGKHSVKGDVTITDGRNIVMKIDGVRILFLPLREVLKRLERKPE